MATNYAYAYAIIDLNTGMCFQVNDTTNYSLRRDYIPIPEYNGDYGLKYYYPIPESVSSEDDFKGEWYVDAAHTIKWEP